MPIMTMTGLIRLVTRTDARIDTISLTACVHFIINQIAAGSNPGGNV